MSSYKRSSEAAISSTDFDMLRAQIESEIARPAVIAIASATHQDGAQVAARGLAASFACGGYKAILIRTHCHGERLSISAQKVRFDETVRQAVLRAESGSVVDVEFSDPILQQQTSQRTIRNSKDVLSEAFDYVIFATAPGGSTSFIASIFSVADAVLATVKKGRREKSADNVLSGILQRLDNRFLGILALDAVAAQSDPAFVISPTLAPDLLRGQPIGVENVFVAGP